MRLPGGVAGLAALFLAESVCPMATAASPHQGSPLGRLRCGAVAWRSGPCRVMGRSPGLVGSWRVVPEAGTTGRISR